MWDRIGFAATCKGKSAEDQKALLSGLKALLGGLKALLGGRAVWLGSPYRAATAATCESLLPRISTLATRFEIQRGDAGPPGQGGDSEADSVSQWAHCGGGGVGAGRRLGTDDCAMSHATLRPHA